MQQEYTYALTVENVEKVLFDCLCGRGRDIKDALIVDVIMRKFGFDRKKLEAERPKIESMLQQLPHSFRQTIGGGMHFSASCHNDKREQWADCHATMEALLALGLAIDKAAFNAPREKWGMLSPDGMPYFYVKY